ncbi:glycerol-3-phosphate dehydrogenase C-terminal domain-containing protein, partial [Streptomyces zhihengii]
SPSWVCPWSPEVPETDIGFLLDVLGSALDVVLGRADVVGAFAGLRPLLDTGDGPGRTADISRRHAVVTSPGGVVTVVGGKLTTYRRMAQDAVDAAVRAGRLTAGPCRTASLPLVGAARPAELAALDVPRRLVRRYGAEAPAVHALGLADPSLARPVVPGHPVTGAELVWAVRHEGALDESDVLDRRTRIGLIAADRAGAREAAAAALAAA